MGYKALYRTYRPQTFSEVIGQDHIVRILQNSIENNKISHAYLFSGPRGTGKTSVARIFAKALNCASSKNAEPCGECLSCNEIVQGMSPDVVEIDAASNNGVDEIREIRDKVKFMPGGAGYKIYIIDEVHMLSQGAFNALLKTLEEPPRHVIFILATTEPHKVIPTILSRCQRFDFKTLSVKEIASVLKAVSEKEGFKISDEAIIGIAEGAEGGMRDALSYLDQAASYSDGEINIDDVNSVTGNLNFDKIVELAKYFEDKNVNKALETVNELVIMGKEINKIVSSLLQFYRDCLLYKNIDVSMFSKYIFEKEDFKELAETINPDKVFYYIDVLSDVQSRIRTTTTPTIYLEVAAIKMVNSSSDDFNYNKKIKELEEKIENISFSPDGVVSNDNNEKINSLEQKLNRVINELSKLELHKLSEKVDELSKESNFELVLKQFEEEIKDLKEKYYNPVSNTKESLEINPDYELKLNQLSDHYKQLESKIEKLDVINPEIVEPTNHNQDLDKKIQQLKNVVLGIQSDIYLIKDSNKDTSKVNLDEIKTEIDIKISQKLDVIKTEFNESKLINENKLDLELNEDLKYELELIKDKINNIESKVYKLMSGELEKIETKKPRARVNRKQTVLFGDELVNLNDFKKPIKEVVNFENINEVSKEEVLIDDKKEENKNIQEKQKPIEEIDVIEDNEKLVSTFGKDEFDDKKIEEITEDEPAKEQEIIKKIQTENEEIIEREHSSLVRKINKEPESPISVPREEPEQKLVQSNPETKLDKTDYVTTTRNYTPPIDMANDEYSNYDVRVLERILHESRSEAAREDKIRIVNLWRNLDRSVPTSQSHIASLLQEGKLVATGKKEFVLVYPNAALCNQVMKLSFKRESLKLLYDFLGDTYNYFAIPEDVWIEKRTEYINQYNIGTRFPKLTPIMNKNLNVVKENKEYLENQESSRSKAISFFGEELVKVE